MAAVVLTEVLGRSVDPWYINTWCCREKVSVHFQQERPDPTIGRNEPMLSAWVELNAREPSVYYHWSTDDEDQD